MRFFHGMRMCLWLYIIFRSFFFFTFFHIVNLVIFHPQYIDNEYLVSTTPHTILYQSFWNFAHVFCVVWRCACAFHIILALIFVIFFYILNFVIFWPQVYSIDSGYLIATSRTILNWSFETLHMFSPWSAEVHVVLIWFLNLFLSFFSSPIRKYRKRYCTTPGVSIGGGSVNKNVKV